MVNPRKVEWVEELTEELKNSPNLIFTGFRGLTVEQMEDLRRQLYECDTTYRVVKNRLARRAFSRWKKNGGATAQKTGEEPATGRPEAEVELTDLPGVGPSTAEDFQEAGFETAADVAAADEQELQEIPGIGAAKAGKIMEAARKHVPAGEKEESEPEPEESTPEDVELDPEITSLLTGNTAIAFNRKDVVKAAKVVVDFAEESETFEIKGGMLDKKILEAEDIEHLSSLPSRRELLTKLAMSLNSPIQKLARYLKDPLQKLVQVMNRVKENKEDSKE